MRPCSQVARLDQTNTYLAHRKSLPNAYSCDPFAVVGQPICPYIGVCLPATPRPVEARGPGPPHRGRVVLNGWYVRALQLA